MNSEVMTIWKSSLSQTKVKELNLINYQEPQKQSVSNKFLAFFEE